MGGTILLLKRSVAVLLGLYVPNVYVGSVDFTAWKNSTRQGEVGGLVTFSIPISSEEKVLPATKPWGLALGITSPPIPIASVRRGHLCVIL